MQEWFSSLPINIKEEFEYSDDCAICQEMKKAEKEGRNLTENELKKDYHEAVDFSIDPR